MPAAQPMPPASDRRARTPRTAPCTDASVPSASASSSVRTPSSTPSARAVTGDRLAHAYLFVGPRGTGKTSTARILAKAINCTYRGADGEPCDACAACVSIREGRALDVIEIDAASHGLVEDARDLVMRALTRPRELRRRVYIIDEVHMLSPHAFNALLKLIEEPPDHVVFILATTDTHRVPATIISRTQRHDFRRLPNRCIVGKLTRIVAAEGADADDEALASSLACRRRHARRRVASRPGHGLRLRAAHRRRSVREAVGLADEDAIGSSSTPTSPATRPAHSTAVADLSDAGRDLARWPPGRGRGPPPAAGLRRRPGAARRLAAILRTLAEAAGRRRARGAIAPAARAAWPSRPLPPCRPPLPRPAERPAPRLEILVAAKPAAARRPRRARPPPRRRLPRPRRPRPRRRPVAPPSRPRRRSRRQRGGRAATTAAELPPTGPRSSIAPAPSSSRSSRSAARSPATARALTLAFPRAASSCAPGSPSAPAQIEDAPDRDVRRFVGHRVRR